MTIGLKKNIMNPLYYTFSRKNAELRFYLFPKCDLRNQINFCLFFAVIILGRDRLIEKKKTLSLRWIFLYIAALLIVPSTSSKR